MKLRALAFLILITATSACYRAANSQPRNFAVDYVSIADPVGTCDRWSQGRGLDAPDVALCKTPGGAFYCTAGIARGDVPLCRCLAGPCAIDALKAAAEAQQGKVSPESPGRKGQASSATIPGERPAPPTPPASPPPAPITDADKAQPISHAAPISPAPATSATAPKRK